MLSFCYNMEKLWRLQFLNFAEYAVLNGRRKCLNVENLQRKTPPYQSFPAPFSPSQLPFQCNSVYYNTQIKSKNIYFLQENFG